MYADHIIQAIVPVKALSMKVSNLHNVKPWIYAI